MQFSDFFLIGFLSAFGNAYTLDSSTNEPSLTQAIHLVILN